MTLLARHSIVSTILVLVGLYVLQGYAAFWVFFRFEPYDDVTGAGAFWYKVWFSIAFFAQTLGTASCWLLLGWLGRIVTRETAIVAVLTILVMIFVNLYVLTAVNSCQGVNFPYETSCPTQEGV